MKDGQSGQSREVFEAIDRCANLAVRRCQAQKLIGHNLSEEIRRRQQQKRQARHTKTDSDAGDEIQCGLTPA